MCDCCLFPFLQGPAGLKGGEGPQGPPGPIVSILLSTFFCEMFNIFLKIFFSINIMLYFRIKVYFMYYPDVCMHSTGGTGREML